MKKRCPGTNRRRHMRVEEVARTLVGMDQGVGLRSPDMAGRGEGNRRSWGTSQGTAPPSVLKITSVDLTRVSLPEDAKNKRGAVHGELDDWAPSIAELRSCLMNSRDPVPVSGTLLMGTGIPSLASGCHENGDGRGVRQPGQQVSLSASPG